MADASGVFRAHGMNRPTTTSSGSLRAGTMRVLLPVKCFDRAKSRLSGVLEPAQRAHLASLLLHDVLDTLCSSSLVSEIWLVGSEPGLVPLAGEGKIRLLPLSRERGHAADLTRALELLPLRPGEPVLILPADVPLLSPAELRELAGAHRGGGLVMCPAACDGGTNALLFEPPLPMPLLFGDRSLSRHRQAALERGVEVRVLDLPGLSRDIDRPEDLCWLARQGRGGLSRGYARRLLA
ncbi:MAG: 2-phospho-L-lactate guanylyltransferase [Gammaproteobacteria bacterium]|nr:MAG: 2-phospho-L-lactate guanylyltransferase [Gammaproteobacteria bacterium]